MKVRIRVLFIILLMSLLSLNLSAALCTSANTPDIKPVNYFELFEDRLFVHDFNLTNMEEDNVSYTLAYIDQLTGVKVNNSGELSFRPSSDDVGLSKIALLAVRGSCADTLIITFRVFASPDIVSYSPRNSSVHVKQGQAENFMIKAEDSEGKSLSYEWFYDGKAINNSVNKTLYGFYADYDMSGVHTLTARATNSKGLSADRVWNVQISRTNRPPVLIHDLPTFMLFWNTESAAYNLNDYFYDPEGGKLLFSYEQIVPDFELKEIEYANISVQLAPDGSVLYNPALNSQGYAYYVFTARDILGLETRSNIARVDIVGSDQFRDLFTEDSEGFCGDYRCSPAETCENCPFDCGRCEDQEELGCEPEWNCTEWSDCQPAGFMFRNCTDLNDCDDNRSKPDIYKRCEYKARCDDGLKNGVEEGVDCGGPCEPCATCSDNIQNQGEEGVDCGGPCDKACPSCFDGVKNQNETDVDCGGPNCEGCAAGKSCLKSKDCLSLRCNYLVCAQASCSDQIKNQGEEGIDCGGPCEKLCGTCSDGIQNQGEEGIDCGGRCRPCPSCSDGLKNQDEKLADCGGSCRECTLEDYIQSYYWLFVIIIVFLIIIPVLIIVYFFYLLSNPEKSKKLYERTSTFAMLVELNNFFRPWRRFRHRKPVVSREDFEEYKAEINRLYKQEEIDDRELHSFIIKIFKELLSLPSDYDKNILNMRFRASNIPAFMKILLAGFYDKANILAMDVFVPRDEKQDMLVELKFLLRQLVKG